MVRTRKLGRRERVGLAIGNWVSIRRARRHRKRGHVVIRTVVILSTYPPTTSRAFHCVDCQETWLA